MPATQLLQITAPHFCGTVEWNISSGLVVKAPPVLDWMVGRKVGDVLDYCAEKGWRFEALPVVKGGQP